jgi:hypothetical protein
VLHGLLEQHQVHHGVCLVVLAELVVERLAEDLVRRDARVDGGVVRGGLEWEEWI